ncbi:MAG: hypothetical protein AB1468_02920 [Candidatus Micrarchaeota archaeon]
MEKTEEEATSKFEALKNRKYWNFWPVICRTGFESVQIMPDGSCKLNRYYCFRRVSAQIDSDYNFIEYHADLNVINFLILFLFLTLPGLIFIYLSGRNNKADLAYEIKCIVEKKKMYSMAQFVKDVYWKIRRGVEEYIRFFLT